MKKPNGHMGAMSSEDKGFYIILFLCIAAIGISGYVLFSTPSPQKSQPLDTSVYESSTAQEDAAVPALRTDTPMTASEEAAAAEAAATDKTSTQSASAAVPSTAEPAGSASTSSGDSKPVSAPVYVRPIEGAVSMPFSDNQLVYQATFGDWRTHNGTDYAAKSGDRVYAITDGTVEDVYQDELYGKCVVLKHSGGLKTFYMGLRDNVKVKSGDTVKAGDILGTVGTTNQIEGADGIHLHVEAVKNGVRINPETLFASATK